MLSLGCISGAIVGIIFYFHSSTSSASKDKCPKKQGNPLSPKQYDPADDIAVLASEKRTGPQRPKVHKVVSASVVDAEADKKDHKPAEQKVWHSAPQKVEYNINYSQFQSAIKSMRTTERKWANNHIKKKIVGNDGWHGINDVTVHINSVHSGSVVIEFRLEASTKAILDKALQRATGSMTVQAILKELNQAAGLRDPIVSHGIAAPHVPVAAEVIAGVDVPDPKPVKSYDFQYIPRTEIKNGWKEADPKNAWSGHVEQITEPSGTTTVAYKNYIADKDSKIGIMIAGNSGRPGGRCGWTKEVRDIHPYHTTQEEDMTSNWMITECDISKNNQQPRKMKGMEKEHSQMNEIYKETIYRKWGLTKAEGDSTDTIQRIDYTSKDLEPWQYGDAWVLKGARLSVKKIDGKKWYDTKQQFPADLFFVSGPSSSMRRTFNPKAADPNNWEFLRASLKAAMRGGLEAMRRNGIEWVYVASLAAGIYAGDHKQRILAKGEFDNIVKEVCNEIMDETDKPRCADFKKVIRVVLDDGDSKKENFQHFKAEDVDKGWKAAGPNHDCVTLIDDPSGTTTQAYEYHKLHPSRKIGIMIAGNSGRPGGYIGNNMVSKTRSSKWVHDVSSNSKTQEEDIVSNWLITECKVDAQFQGSWDLMKNDGSTRLNCMSKIYVDSIYEKWGMSHPMDKDKTMTIQGVDYTTNEDAWRYSDAWVVKGAHLSAKAIAGGAMTFEIDKQFPADLFFVAGPNADKTSKSKGDFSSMRLTYSAKAANDYVFFRQSVKAAVRAGLEAMRVNEIDVAFVAGISTNRYAGVHKKQINKEFRELVEKVCNEVITNINRHRCHRFKHVYWVRL